jgi:hypothetical protein
MPGGKKLTRLLDSQWLNQFLPMRKLQSGKQVLVDLSYHSVLSLPIDCSDIFDECWYRPRSNHDKSVVSKLLNEVTEIPIAREPPDTFIKRRQGLSSLIENSRKKQAKKSAQIDADLKSNDQEMPRKLLLLGMSFIILLPLSLIDVLIGSVQLHIHVRILGLRSQGSRVKEDRRS